MQAQHFAAILVLFLSVQKGCTQTIIVGEVPPSPPSPFPALVSGTGHLLHVLLI